MAASFDRLTEGILNWIGVDAHIRVSVRAPSLPAPGLERSGAAFDYLFITPDAVCFLQPNPPTLLAILDFAAISGLEWNGENLFIEPKPDAEITIAEATTGWGTKIKRVDVETAPAEKFFDVWTRWRLRPNDLQFAEEIASSAGLSRDETEVGTTTWECDHGDP